jgi:hypothetical protein
VDRTSVLASAARILAHAVLVSVIKPTPTAGMILPRGFFSDFAAFFMSFLLSVSCIPTIIPTMLGRIRRSR